MANLINAVDYSRQEALDNTLESNAYNKQQINVIIGCGGVGYWLGSMLAMMGHKAFLFIEGESIDYSNLNRLPVPQTWVGVNKAVALRKTIRTMRPDTTIICLNTHITEDTLHVLKNLNKRFKHPDAPYYTNNTPIMVWDTTDDARIQTKIYEFAQANRYLTYRKLGYEGMNIGAYAEYSVWTADDYQQGYRTSNANAVTSALSACMGIFARSMTNDDVEINIQHIIQQAGNVAVDTEMTENDKDKISQALHDELGAEDRQYVIDNLRERGIVL